MKLESNDYSVNVVKESPRRASRPLIGTATWLVLLLCAALQSPGTALAQTYTKLQKTISKSQSNTCADCHAPIAAQKAITR